MDAMNGVQTDEEWMRKALGLAQQALFLSNPNPRVGCVLTDAQGRLAGQGFTQAAGGAHAEIMALQDAQARGHPLQGGCAFVTLEPCAHQGRTGPCCEALAQTGLARVVVACLDPNPRVNGRGVAYLREQGCQVEVGVLEHESVELNVGFFSRMKRQRPWVRMKIAASLDGFTALPNGQSQWLTGPEARADGHAWRARACAILTGSGTVRHDDPLLDVRSVETPRQPALVLVDAKWQTPPSARLWQRQRPVWVYGATHEPAAQAALLALGADLRTLPNAASKVDLAALLSDLAEREINELHIEAGHRLNGSFLQASLVDELLIYLAPKMLGQGLPMAHLSVLEKLDLALEFEWVECHPVGGDLRLRARKRQLQ